MNILVNLLEVIVEDGILVVIGIKEEKCYIMKFFDNGRGILIENLFKVIDEFFIGNFLRIMKYLGFGLVLVKKIIELYNSFFDIESIFGIGMMIMIDFVLGGEIDEN